MGEPLIVAAAIGAIPATLAAVAAFQVKKLVRTNGTSKTLGELAEINHAILIRHIADSQAHDAN